MLAPVLIAAALQVSAQARSLQPGELVVFTIVTSPAVKRVRVRAFDRDVLPFAVRPSQWRALVGIDLDTAPGPYVVTVDADGEGGHAIYRLVVQPRKFPTRHLTVDPDFVTPPPSARDRIDREQALLESVWRSPAPERLWTAPFRRPVPQPANSAFGTRSVFNGVSRTPHGGADFMSPSGTPVHAPNAGRIVVARDLYFSGNTVVIDHGLGLFSTLAHLSAFEVREGDRVEADQIIGRVGATGRVTGPHLHWAIRAGRARVDPLSVLSLLGKAE